MSSFQTPVVSGENIPHPKDHFILVRMLKTENRENMKKAYKSVVCNMNQLS